MKKIMILSVLTTLLVVSLVGCGQPTTSEISSENESSSTAIETNNDEGSSNKYLPCIAIENDIAFFDMTVDEFVENYNNIVEDSDNPEMVKALMLLNTSPKFEFTNGGIDAYNITNTAVVQNRSAVNVLANTLEGTQKIHDIAFIIPDTASSSVNISTDVEYTLIALAASTEGPEYKDAYDKLISDLKANGYAYNKGILIASYNYDGGRMWRVSALTEEDYNELN